MWSEGIFTTNEAKKACRYWVKHFDEPSEEYGIEGGRISKLMIKIGNKITCNYDRGWDIEPEDETSQLAYATILREFN